MKHYIYILAAAALLATACNKEEIRHPSEADAPKTASAYTPVITVDQEINQVTFSVDGKGIIPVWVLQDKSGEWTSYNARNGYKRIFTAAGDYLVRMYVMNASGITPDYVEKTFHIDNTLVNFDKYIKLLSSGGKVWRINNDEPGHMACGESVDNAGGWWSAPVNDKAAFGVYDNRLSFTAEGDYTFDPGAAGTVYVNKDVTAAPYGEFRQDADYTVPVEAQTTPYEFEVEGDAVLLKLQPGARFPYIPNNDYLTSSRFTVVSIEGNAMTLVWFTPTGNNGGPIAWQFILTSKEAGAGASDPLYGTGTKTWKMAAELPAHMACGPDASNPAGWWSAAPNEKEGAGVYDNRLSFAADGTFTFDPGEDGQIYVNYGCSTVDGQTHSEPDFTYAWEKQSGKYSFDGETLTLPEHFTIGYIPNDAAYANPTFAVTELSDTKMVLRSDADGISWQFIFVPADGGSQGGGEENPGSYTYGENLMGGLYLKETYFTAAGWAGGLDPQCRFEGGKFTLTVPAGTGGEEWMGQVKLVADIPADPEKKYGFFANIESSTDGVCTVKVADADNDRDHAFFYDPAVGLTAYNKLAYAKENIAPDQAYAAVMVIFDFGRLAPGTEISVSGIELKEITGSTGGGGGSETAELTYDSPDNLFKAAFDAGTYELGYYYAPGWSPIANPVLDLNGHAFTWHFPTATSAAWQSQVFLVFPQNLVLSAAKTYDVQIRFTASQDLSRATFKMHFWASPEPTEQSVIDSYNGNVFFDVNKPAKAYEESLVSATAIPGIDAGVPRLVIDFGGNPADTDVTVSEIIIQEHK